MTLTPNQSHYVLSALVSQGKVRPSQVQATLKGRQREISKLRERLAALEGLGPSSRGRGGRRRGGRRRAAAGTRRRPRMSARVRALRRLQGKYMGFVRRLKLAEKARVRAVREKHGIAAAIRMAAALARRAS